MSPATRVTVQVDHGTLVTIRFVRQLVSGKHTTKIAQSE